MPRPSQIDRQREQLLSVVSRTFSELGYRRTTTAELARRCGVRENILYRLWSDKKAMFLAAIDDLFQQRSAAWQELTPELPEATDRQTAVRLLIEHEAKHLGELGFYRIVFSALGETDDPDIRAALARMYRQFHRTLQQRLKASREPRADDPALPDDVAAWGLIGLATVSNVIRQLELLPASQREDAFKAVAGYLVQ